MGIFGKAIVLALILSAATATAPAMAAPTPTAPRIASARDWTPIASGAGWSQCGGPITWSLDAGELSPSVARAQVGALKWAFDQWQGASGLAFTFTGQTPTQFIRSNQILEPTDGVERPRHIYVTWLSPTTAPALSGRTSGFAAPDHVSGSVIRGARAVFKANYVTTMTKRSMARVKALYLHEIGHVLGLGHASRTSNVMFGIVDAGTRLGAGDINGVQHLTRPCQ